MDRRPHSELLTYFARFEYSSGLWKGGLMTQGLYVSPSRDLVFVYFNTQALAG